MTTTRQRLTTMAAALIATTLIGACSDDTTPTQTSTTSSPTYDQTLEGGTDPSYEAGFKQVKSVLSLKNSAALPPEAARYATPKYIADTNKQNADFTKTYDITTDTTRIEFSAWRGTLLNRNTQRLSWHMELGVCQTVLGKLINSKGQTVAEGPQTRLIRYTLTSADKGKTWLVDDSQFVPTETSASRFDPPCKGNINPSASSTTTAK